jgi:tubulin polyglutamylase TTLL1
LTNDAIQKRGDDYGKFEGSNKISFADFQKYLDTEHPMERLSVKEIFFKMKLIATDLVHSIEHLIDPHNKQFCFELFGLDFMIDNQWKPLLI